MHNNVLAMILGQALADSDDVTLPGIEAVVGELALHIRSVSGPDLGAAFLAKVASNSLRIMDGGTTPGVTTMADAPREIRSDVLGALLCIEDAMTGSTSPSL